MQIIYIYIIKNNILIYAESTINKLIINMYLFIYLFTAYNITIIHIYYMNIGKAFCLPSSHEGTFLNINILI